jgi:O-antigen ligase
MTLTSAPPSTVASRDAASVLTIYLVLLLGIPASMRIEALGSAGSPATVVAVVAFFWWAWYHLHRDDTTTDGAQPVRAAVLAWLLIVLIAYVHAMARPLPGDEINPGDSGLLRVIGWAGLLLTANDGLVGFERARTVVRRFVIAVGLVALLGVVQNFTGQLWTDRLTIPGLTTTYVGELVERSGLNRVGGTATHPIEFGVVLTMALPLAIAHARMAPRHRWFYRIVVALVAVTIFLCISRSAIVCGVVAMAVMMWWWPMATRLWALLVLVAISAAVYLSVPGVLGTITKLFSGAGEDTSVASRTGSYDVAFQFIGRSPWIGRGFGTYLPKYWILDNGYLVLLIEAGVLGLVGLLVVIGAGVLAALRATAVLTDPFDREVARALVASICAGSAALAFFDLLSFPQSAAVFFLVIGLAGAWRRLALLEHPAPDATREAVH